MAAIVEMTLVVLGYALGPLIVSRRLADLASLDVVAVSIGLCALVYAPVGIAQLPPAMPSPAVIGSVGVLGIACTAVAFLLFFRLIAEVGPVRATVITYVNPAIALLAGVTVLGEPFTPGTAVGFVLIIAGSWLATGPSRSRRVVHAAAPDSPEQSRPVAHRLKRGEALGRPTVTQWYSGSGKRKVGDGSSHGPFCSSSSPAGRGTRPMRERARSRRSHVDVRRQRIL